MTDESSEVVEITRAEWAELKARVRRLEDQVSDTSTDVSDSNELDSRDEAVIDQLEDGQSYTGVHIKKLYKKCTDIRQDSTAKQRAKTLLSRDSFERDGRRFTFGGRENEDE